MVTIGIVGGGFSGLLTAYHLLSNTEKPLKLTLFNHRFPSGRGIAYCTNEPAHLLNVPAGKMSALPEDPFHFTRWLDQNSTQAFSTSTAIQFVSRKTYGEYLDLIYQFVKASPAVKIIEKEVIDFSKKDREYCIHCNDVTEIVHTVALATGNLLPSVLGLGLHANSNGQLLDKENKRINNIYTLGPTLKSKLWETTAVNEIRNQAKKTAKTILFENGLIT